MTGKPYYYLLVTVNGFALTHPSTWHRPAIKDFTSTAIEWALRGMISTIKARPL